MSSPQALPVNGNYAARLASSVEAGFAAPNWYPRQVEWVRDPATPENSAHNYCLALRIHGRLHAAALQSGLDELLRRHEVLRSVFRVENGRLVQCVLPSAQLFLARHDLVNLPTEVAETKALKLAVEEACQPFDLREGPFLRASLFQIRAEDHLLLLTTHHSVCDDWSVGILLRELSALYSAHRAGAPVSLPKVARTYSQFASELSSRIKSGKMEPQVRFWKRFLAHANEFHHLIPDYPRPPKQTYNGAHKVLLCPESLTQQIRSLALREQVSPFMVLSAGFQCLLARYSGQDDIGLGSCVANRLSTNVEELVGPLSNRIVLRVDLSGDPPFREVLQRVRSSTLDAYSHQDLPYGELTQALAPAAASSRNPLFQVLMVLKEDPLNGCEFPGLDLSWFEFETGTTRYDLNVWLQFESGRGLKMDFQYNRDLFKQATVRWLVENYETLLHSMVERSNVPISKVSLTIPQGRDPVQIVTEEDKPSALEVSEETRVRAIFEETLNVQPVSIHSDFFALGGNSLQAAQLFARIEQEFRIKLALSTLLRARTVAQLAQLLRHEGVRPVESSLVGVQPAGSRLPLFCVHSHRGDVLYCGALSRYLGPEQPVFGIQSRGLVGAPPHFTVQEMADHYVGELVRFQPSGPYLLFGYSFGGLVAFEMSARLLAESQEVAFLGMFNTPAPGSLNRWPLGQASYLRRRTSHALETSVALAGRERIAHLARKASNFSRMLASSLRTDFWRLAAKLLGRAAAERVGKRILDIEHINIAAAKGYRPQTVFPGQITFFLSRRLPYLYSIAPRDGWSPFATGGVELIDVPEENEMPLERVLSRALEAKIGRLQTLPT